MKDLYKRLKVRPDASPEAIRQGLAGADPSMRAATEVVLLDPRRRKVYDRNRQLLITIAQLRLSLGLNYTRFWARGELKDFWADPAFSPPPASQEKPRRRVDKMMIAQAFHTVRHHGRRHAARWGWWWAAAWGIGYAAAILAMAIWRSVR